MNVEERIAEARKRNFRDEDIVDVLSLDKTYGPRIKKAREKGYPPDEILKVLTTGKGYDRYSIPGAATAGVYSGLAAGVGAPVDVTTAMLNASMRAVPPTSPYYEQAQPIERPVGGAQWIREQMRKVPGVRPYESIEDLDPRRRPIAAPFEVAGAAAPYAIAPYAIPGSAARASPLAFGAGEVAGISGAATGAALSRLLFPESATAQLSAEVAGGFASPLRSINRALGKAVPSATQAVRSFTKRGREEAAARILQQAMQDAGEDPAAVIARLRESPAITGMRPTAALKSESPTLLALEKKLMQQNQKFGVEFGERVEDSLEALRQAADRLATTGDPQLLRAAAIARKAYFDRMIQGRLDAAKRQATQAYAGMPSTAESQAVSQRAATALDEALTEARRIEAEKWGAVDRNFRLTPDRTLAAYDQLRSTLLPEEKVQPLVEAFVRRLQPYRQPTGAMISPRVTSGEVLRFRSRMMDLARDAKGRGEFDLARQYNAMADGALEDIGKVPGTATEDARAYTRALHDSFTRTFAGQALAVSKTGAERISSEQMLERAVGGGGTAADVRLRGLQTAAEFAGGQFGRQMANEQEQFLRIAAMQLRDPTSGRIAPERLAKFTAENQATLERFPFLRSQLGDAQTAERALKDAERMSTVASRSIEQRAAFSQLLGQEDPSRVLERVLTSGQPETSYAQLQRLAVRGGPGAVAGLKSSVLDYVMRKSTDSAGNFSFDRYATLLNSSIRRGGYTPLQLMEINGTMPRGEAARMRTILNEAGKIERALASRTAMEQIGDAPDALFDFVVRAVGANLGGASALGQASGVPLVMAGRGSEAARRLFEKIPATRLSDVMVEASRDPNTMALLLEKTKSPTRQRKIAQQLNSFLIGAGIRAQPALEELAEEY